LSTVIHPEDIARLLFAFAGATTGVDASAHVRLLWNGGAIPVDIEVARPGDGEWRVSFASARGAENDASQRVRELQHSLERIARELHGAGVIPAPSATGDIFGFPGVAELPARQREIVGRLAGGERVGTIAAKMYLSPNTVRNHLSVVFTKFGVHSQEELLTLLRQRRDGSASEG
jgi:DNA-binding CsgD family transcriptional regulator